MAAEVLGILDGAQCHLLAFLVGTPRLFMLVQTAPFLGGGLVTGQVRFALVAALYLVMHPFMLDQVQGLDLASAETCFRLLGLVLKEGFLGLLLGFLAGLMFWVIESAGFFIDNQRGASQATENNPFTAGQTSVTGNFLFQSMVYVFFSTGGFVTFLGLVYASYELWPAGSALPVSFFRNPAVPVFFAGQVSRLALDMVLVAGPVVLACLFTDIALGLVNRFASQLNVYVLAMPIKSGISSFLLIFYFGMLVGGAAGMFEDFGTQVRLLGLMFQ